ncbi:hypothetical protein ABZX77_27195 [Streptomyces sp. NPDC004237]|uniref:hypothetical protein n=1 Tax=Streptomyces sp. NPDC004237 TaxID=3154455 RepID=UPI0033AB445B
MENGHGGLASLAALVLLLTAAACTSADGAPGPPGTPASGRSAAAAPPSGDAAALAAYQAMWGDVVVAARTSDAGHSRLDDHAEGGALQLLLHMMRANKEQGVVTKGQPTFAPVVTKAGASTVVIQDCADDSRWLQYTEDGSLKDDVPGGHHRVDATVSKHGGRWLVESLYIGEVGTCVQ